jgi:hypothetical protein
MMWKSLTRQFHIITTRLPPRPGVVRWSPVYGCFPYAVCNSAAAGMKGLRERRSRPKAGG